MGTDAKEKGHLCICRYCGKIFNYRERVKVVHKYDNKDIFEYKSPCHEHDFTFLNTYDSDLEKYFL